MGDERGGKPPRGVEEMKETFIPPNPNSLLESFLLHHTLCVASLLFRSLARFL
jgi:hypothetical protein